MLKISGAMLYEFENDYRQVSNISRTLVRINLSITQMSALPYIRDFTVIKKYNQSSRGYWITYTRQENPKFYTIWAGANSEHHKFFLFYMF